MLGRKGGSPLSWNPVTEYPLSDHVHFRVNVPQNAASGEFTVHWPNGYVEHPAGTFCMFGAQRAFTTGLEFTGGCLDDEWSVSCVVHCGQCGDLTFGPTSFDVKNLSVGSMSVAGGGTNLYQDEVFASALCLLSDTTFLACVHDGIEVLPPGADPQQWVVDAALSLVPLAAGAQVSATASGAVGESTPMEGALGDIQPGLYYKNVAAHERMLSAPSGGPDSAQAYSSALSILLASTEGFEWTAERQGELFIHLHSSPWTVPPSGSLGVVRAPSGTAQEVGLGVPECPDQTVATSAASFPVAGAYEFGLTLRDNGGNMHDRAAKWAVPTQTSFRIPASFHCAGRENGQSDPNPAEVNYVDDVYDLLGEVLSAFGGNEFRSFYSGVDPIHVRGGPVYAPPVPMVIEACRDDDIFHFSGHSWWDSLQVSNTDFYIGDIPAGDMDQVRVALLGGCSTLMGPNSIGVQMVDVGGAKAVVGYTFEVYGPTAHWLEWDFWNTMARQLGTVSQAVLFAKERFIIGFGLPEYELTGAIFLHEYPVGSGQTILPTSPTEW